MVGNEPGVNADQSPVLLELHPNPKGFSVVGDHLSPDCHLAATTPLKLPNLRYRSRESDGATSLSVVSSSGLLCAREHRTPFLF